MKSILIKILLFNLLFSLSLFANSFQDDIKNLTKSSFKTKQNVIEKIVEKYPENEKLQIVLNNMLSGELYYKKYKKEFVILLKKEGKNYFVKELFTNKELEATSKKMFKKVKTNNKLRSYIKSQLAILNLFSKDENKRIKSVKNILKNLDKSYMPIINKAIKTEKNSKVKDILLEIDTIFKAKYKVGQEQKDAIKELGSFLSSKTIQALNEFKNSEDKEIQKLALASIASIETTKSYYTILEKAFFGLSMGSVLLLAAIGLAVTFGVMKVINMAHGELIMIGAYTTYTIQQIMPNLIEYSILVAIPAAFIVSGIVGILIERLVIRHLYGRPLETLLATFGISLILQQIVRTVYSPLNQEVKTPEWMSGALEINSALSFTYNRLYIIIFAVIIFLVVLFILNKTSLGLKVRAVSQNREIARAMGIKASWIDAITFGIGSGIAGVAGVALSQLTNVGPNLGQAYIVDSFMVVVFGGVGNLWGTFIAAFTLGEINKFIEPLSGAVLAKVIILVFIILFIQKRPRGLFPKKGRDAQD